MHNATSTRTRLYQFHKVIVIDIKSKNIYVLRTYMFLLFASMTK